MVISYQLSVVSKESSRVGTRRFNHRVVIFLCNLFQRFAFLIYNEVSDSRIQNRNQIFCEREKFGGKP